MVLALLVASATSKPQYTSGSYQYQKMGYDKPSTGTTKTGYSSDPAVPPSQWAAMNPHPAVQGNAYGPEVDEIRSMWMKFLP